jgi:pSer/pThr/pTyr-binding forkhead associated (FHA) protein
MNSRNPMIVGREAMPEPGDPVGLLIGGEDRSRTISLSIDGLRKDFRLNSRDRPLLMIGRSKQCDIVLPHTKVSTRHACLKLIGNQIYCVDLFSRNGTFWGNKRCSAGWLKVGRPITIRPFSIAAESIDDVALQDVELPEVDLLSKQDYDRLPCQAEITFLNGLLDNGGINRRKIVRPITLIGNSPRCKMWFDDSSVSRAHCSLIVTPSGLWVIDLLSKSGTYVNSERVNFRLLRESDEVRIGCFRFTVSYRLFSESNFQESPQPLSTVEREDREQKISSGGAGISEEFVLSLVDRFAAMQQQITSMNHQQMMTMLQMMNTMHQNHHDLVQRELTRIHRIDYEIQQIQSKLFGGNASCSPVSPSPISPSEAHTAQPDMETPLSPLRVSIEGDKPAAPADIQASQHVETDPPPATESEADLEAAMDHDCTQDQNASESMCGAVCDEAAVDAGHVVESADHDVADDSTDQHVDALEAKVELETRDTIEEPASVLPRDQEKKRTVSHDVNDHLRFIERLSTLERERNSRWKKIMRMLTGSSR